MDNLDRNWTVFSTLDFRSEKGLETHLDKSGFFQVTLPTAEQVRDASPTVNK